MLPRSNGGPLQDGYRIIPTSQVGQYYFTHMICSLLVAALLPMHAHLNTSHRL